MRRRKDEEHEAYERKLVIGYRFLILFKIGNCNTSSRSVGYNSSRKKRPKLEKLRKKKLLH